MKILTKLSIISILVFLVLFFFFKNYRNITSSIPQKIKDNLPLDIVDIHFTIENYINLISNKDYLYNAKFLPDTHLANKNGDVELVFNEIDVSSIDNMNKIDVKKFYIDLYKDKVFLFSNNADIFYLSDSEINLDSKKITPLKVKTNLNKYQNLRLIDSYIKNENLYISIYEKKDGFCDFKILHSTMSLNKLFFEEIFHNPGCSSDTIQGGRMQHILLDDVNGLLFSLAENRADKPNFKAQDDKSFLGKIIFLNLENYKSTIYSKGHRNPQGLYVENDLVLSTEHGPQGGDEINKIIRGKNYGWPIASYGKFYNNQKGSFLNNHYANNFEEPIYTYFTAIGISEIVKIPEIFFNIRDLDNIFFVSSLRGKSLHLVKFNNNYNRVIFSEKIFINQKIRDLKFHNKKNIFLLALQEPTKIGILAIK
jgi:hypothetical protein